MSDFSFGQWTPDQPDVGLNGLLRCDNVLPTLKGYRQFPGRTLVPGKSALPGVCVGAFSGENDKGEQYIVAGVGGTTPSLHLAWGTSADWIDVTPSGGITGFPSSLGQWQFAEFYNDIIAVAPGVVPLYLNTDTTPTPLSEFTEFPVDASIGAVCGVFKDFLILGDVTGRGVNASAIGELANGIHWCAIGNATGVGSWPEIGTDDAVNVQSDFQRFDGNGGRVTAIVPGGDYCLVFQENQIWRLDYVGAPAVFAVRNISPTDGCVARNLAVAVKQRVYFVSAHGFQMCDGANVVDIGNQRVDDSFLSTYRSKVSANECGAYDADRHAVLWSVGEGLEPPRQIYGYQYELDRWFRINDVEDFQWLLTTKSVAVGGSLDLEPWKGLEMDNNTGDDTLETTNLDTLGAVGNELTLAFFNGANRLATFDDEANPLLGILESGDYKMPDGRRSILRWVRPYWDGSAGLVAVESSGRSAVNEAISFTPMTLKVKDGLSVGRIGSRSGGRYLRARFLLSGPCDEVYGFDAGIKAGGAKR